MQKTSGIIPAVAIALAAFAVGAGGALVLERRMVTRDVLSMTLAHELEATGMCANALRLNAANDPARLTTLLEWRLDAGIGRVERLVDQGARLESCMPNLRESVRRAAEYYSASGDADRQRRAATLLAALNGTENGVNSPAP